MRFICTLNTPEEIPFYNTDGPDVFSSVKCDQNVIRRKYTRYSKATIKYSFKFLCNLNWAAVSN